eukprot:3468182-Amphidinium_carterae.1
MEVSATYSESEMGNWSEVQTEPEKDAEKMPVELVGSERCGARSRSRTPRSRSRTPRPRSLRRRVPVVVTVSSSTSSSTSSRTSSSRSTSSSSSASSSNSTSTDSRPLTDLLVEKKESSTAESREDVLKLPFLVLQDCCQKLSAESFLHYAPSNAGSQGSEQDLLGGKLQGREGLVLKRSKFLFVLVAFYRWTSMKIGKSKNRTEKSRRKELFGSTFLKKCR